jgi:hypothetical protein
MNTIDAISMKTGLLILLLIGRSTTFADNAPVTPPANPVPIFKCPMPPRVSNASGVAFGTHYDMSS